MALLPRDLSPVPNILTGMKLLVAPPPPRPHFIVIFFWEQLQQQQPEVMFLPNALTMTQQLDTEQGLGLHLKK